MASQTPNVVRVRLQVLCNFHSPGLRAGEEHLRAAMAEYAQSVLAGRERENTFGGSLSAAAR